MWVEDFSIMHSRISLTEYRRHLPTAMLMAQVLNALGGKGDGKPMPESKRFDPEELLPAYARPAALTRDLPFAPVQCQAIMEAVAAREIPSWAVQILSSVMPMAQIMRHGGTRKTERDDGFDQVWDEG